MAYTQEYSKFNVWLCKSPFVPSGMCYPDKCVSNYIATSVKTKEKSFVVNINGVTVKSSTVSSDYTEVKAYLVDDDNEYNVDVFLVPEDKDGICLLEGLACTQISDINSDAPWERDGDKIIVKMPKIRSCGLNSLKIVYSGTNVSYLTISAIGEITTKLPAFTHNSGSYLIIPCSLTNTNLIPGERISVYYRMDGHDEYFILGKFGFQTDIFTSGIVRGCGLVEKIKIYNDPTRPEDGYTYDYSPVSGGIGSSFRDEWLYDERLRWCVEFYGKNYWLKSVYPCRVNIGTRIGIIKNIDGLPYTTDKQIDSSMAKETLSEASDRIVPEFFY